jgi:hypothetical protein
MMLGSAISARTFSTDANLRQQVQNICGSPQRQGVLDTHVGHIRWMAPFSDRWIVFFHVPSLHHPKILKFVFHWTFVFEIALVVSAIYVFTQSRKVSRRLG